MISSLNREKQTSSDEQRSFHGKENFENSLGQMKNLVKGPNKMSRINSIQLIFYYPII